jgi:ABC-2 type transport system permease protein
VNVLAIFKREVRSYFTSPIAYVLLTIFAVICGFMMTNFLVRFQMLSFQAAMNPAFAQGLNATEYIVRPLLRNVAVILLFLMPIITMRLFAEERKTGTLELLFTYPIRDTELLFGKFLAALAIFLVMLAFPLVNTLMLTPLASLEWQAIAVAFAGLTLLGMTFLGMGLFFSSLTENQIVAAVLTFGAALLFWIIDWAADSATGALGQVLSHLSIIRHFDSFHRGVIETKDLIFYLNVTIFGLFLTMRAVESHRWRG